MTTTQSAIKILLASPRSLLTVGLFLVALLLVPDLVLVSFIGVLLATILSWSTSTLVNHRLPHGLAYAITLFLMLLLALGILTIIIVPFVQQAGLLAERFPDLFQEAIESIETLTGIGISAAIQDGDMGELFLPAAGDIWGGLLDAARIASATLLGVAIILAVGIYVAYEPNKYHSGILFLSPPSWRSDTQHLLIHLGASLRGWLLSQVIIMISVGFLTMVTMFILDLPFWFLLGVTAGLLEVVPFLGPIIAYIPAAILALSTGTPIMLVWVSLAYLGIQQVESNVLSPLVFRERMRLPPAITIVTIAVMGGLFGLLGILVAVPLLAVVFATASFYDNRHDEKPCS